MTKALKIFSKNSFNLGALSFPTTGILSTTIVELKSECLVTRTKAMQMQTWNEFIVHFRLEVLFIVTQKWCDVIVIMHAGVWVAHGGVLGAILCEPET